MEGEWTADKDAYTAVNAKVINDVKGMGSRIYAVVNEQLKTVTTQSFSIFLQVKGNLDFF